MFRDSFLAARITGIIFAVTERKPFTTMKWSLNGALVLFGRHTWRRILLSSHTHLLNGFVETRGPSGAKKEHHQVWLQQRKFRKRKISKREK
jgi:hypothetical protein